MPILSYLCFDNRIQYQIKTLKGVFPLGASLELEITCKSCGKVFTYKKKEAEGFTREDKSVRVYLDCPHCDENDVYEVKVADTDGK